MYDITEPGNFEGENIPNQIDKPAFDDSMSRFFPVLYEYRKKRTELHKDDKILTAWNGLMIAALADAFAVLGNESYLEMAKRAADFIEKNLCENDRVFTSFREGKRTNHGFLDDYAFYIYSLLRLYHAAPEERYLARAKQLTGKAAAEFFDDKDGGFYLTGSSGEPLVARPKESYDGAIPSGNSAMVMNLLTLNLLTGEYGDMLDKQIDFMISQAADIPGGHSFFLYAMLIKEFTKRNPADYICDENGCCRVVLP